MATDSTVNLATGQPTQSGMPRTSIIPSAIVESGLMSDTSKASDCFIHQQFSNKLQAFLIGYTNAVFSYYSVYDS